MRTLFAAIAGFVCLAFAALPAAAAPSFATPEELIAYAYQPYANGTFPEETFELFSPSLIALIDAAEARLGEDEVGPIDFDPYIDAQDYDTVSMTIDSLETDGDKAHAKLTVINFGQPAHLELVLVNTATGWMVDDIARTDGEMPWRLSEMLAADPLLN